MKGEEREGMGGGDEIKGTALGRGEVREKGGGWNR